MWKWLTLVCLIVRFNFLNAEINVLAFSGSTREESYNQKLIAEASKIASDLGARVTFINLKDFPIPFYDGDIEDAEGMPNYAQAMRELFLKHEVIMIASPNYNEAPSAVLKNVLDWMSRSLDAQRSRDVYAGKKFVLMTASTGKSGGMRSLPPLQHIIEHCGGTVLPEYIAIPYAHRAFDDQGKFVDENLRNNLKALIENALQQ